MVEDAVYHDKCVIINSLMQQEGWKTLEAEFVCMKNSCLEKLARCESGLEVAGVEQKSHGVTIVVLNKDILQHELAFWKTLEKKFYEWQIEALKKEGD